MEQNLASALGNRNQSQGKNKLSVFEGSMPAGNARPILYNLATVMVGIKQARSGDQP